MHKPQNDFFANTQTALDSCQDFHAEIVLHPTRKISFNINGSQNPGVETQSFLVDWELPKIGKYEAIKPSI